MEFVELSNGAIMPYIGLGTAFHPLKAELIEPILDAALELGYRHFDTAYIYYTEPFLGRVADRWIKAGRIKREDIFVVTKLPQIGMTPEKVSYFLQKSLNNLQMDYVDLYLMHWPVGLEYTDDDDNIFPKDETGAYKMDVSTDLIAIWREMERMVSMGLCKAIGVSNFNVKQLQRIHAIAKEHISVNQVEVHVYLQQNELRDYCARHNIWVTAYHPLGGPGRDHYPKEWNSVYPKLMEEEKVIEIAAKYDRTPSQVLLRFLIQMGVAAVPKTLNLEHLRQNYPVTNFNLKQEDMKILHTLDKGELGRSCFCFLGSEKHPEYPFESCYVPAESAEDDQPSSSSSSSSK